MMANRVRITVSPEQLADICRRHRIRWLGFFGSVLREDFRPDSDVDVLVEFEPGQKYTYFTLAQIEEDLSAVFGRKADVHVPNLLHPFLRDKVLRQVETVYVGT